MKFILLLQPLVDRWEALLLYLGGGVARFTFDNLFVSHIPSEFFFNAPKGALFKLPLSDSNAYKAPPLERDPFWLEDWEQREELSTALQIDPLLHLLQSDGVTYSIGDAFLSVAPLQGRQRVDYAFSVKAQYQGNIPQLESKAVAGTTSYVYLPGSGQVFFAPDNSQVGANIGFPIPIGYFIPRLLEDFARSDSSIESETIKDGRREFFS